ncbi:sensor histidine kinase [Falsiroseomonas sp.]|uniref:sensor histidine kinase n=1 Tax=Falsiroseomonas sp. TaxID=2870721 RepID=UPI003565C0F2
MYISLLARVTSAQSGRGWRAVLVALALTAAAAAIRTAMEPFAPGTVPFATFFVSTLLAAILGGALAGAVATIAGALFSWFWLLPPSGSFGLTPTSIVNEVLFIVSSATIVATATLLRAALRRAATAEQTLGARLAELQALMDLAPVAIWFARAPDVREVTRNRFAAELMRAPIGTGTPLAPASGGAGLANVELRRNGRRVPPDEMPLQRAMRGEESHNEEYEMVFADGEAIALLSNARPVRDARGNILGAVSASLNITALKATERALREAVAHRELLQREADHRIKNSLQLVAGVLRLQRGRLAEPAAALALDEAVSRVNAVAEAHGALQRSPDLRNADAGAMVAKLCRLADRLNPDVTVSCSWTGDTHLEVDRAIPLGLVVSELLTNALCHAYPPGQAGVVQVRVAGPMAEVLEVEVRDDGIGMPAPGDRPGSLGGDLVRTLSARIGAAVETESTPGQGATVRLRMARSPAPAEDTEAQPEPAAS